MKPISVTTRTNGHVDDHHIYALKEGWHEVPVAELVDYQTRISKLTRVRQLIATAAWLTDVPPSILSSDVSIPVAIVSASGWLSELPPASGPIICFTHAGIEYTHVGNLDTITAGQMEALMVFLSAAGDEPAAAFHQLLAVLYTPTGHPQTAASVTATAEAFKTLPVTTAWAALAFFLSSSASSASRIQQFSSAHAEASLAVSTMSELVEEKLAASESFWQRWRWKGAAVWIKSATKLLATSSPSKTCVAAS